MSPPSMLGGHAALLWIGTAHARCRLAEHAPPGPAEHARRACSAWVGGLPPPAASRSRWSLLPAATPRVMGLRRNQPFASAQTERADAFFKRHPAADPLRKEYCQDHQGDGTG